MICLCKWPWSLPRVPAQELPLADSRGLPELQQLDHMSEAKGIQGQALGIAQLLELGEASRGLCTGGHWRRDGSKGKMLESPDTPAAFQLNTLRQQGTCCLSHSHVPNAWFCGDLKLSLSSEQHRETALGQTHPGEIPACAHLRCYLGHRGLGSTLPG